MTQTATQLEQLAWSIAKPHYRARGVWPDDSPPDRWAAQVERRWAALDLLKAYREMLEIANANVEEAFFDALGNGASYVELAEAQGVSRQAIRQRIVRAGEPVRLAGGPHDGLATTLPIGMGETVCWEEASFTVRHNFEVVEREILSCYTKKKGAQGLYEFSGFVDNQGQPVPQEHLKEVQLAAARRASKSATSSDHVRRESAMRRPRRPPLIRVHELAKELQQPSKRVLSLLEELGTAVKNASSAVPPPLAYRVREHFRRLRPPEET